MSVFGGRNGWYQSDEKKFKDSGTIYIDDVIDRQVAISLFSFVFFFVVVDWILLLVMSSSVFAVPYSDYSFAVFGDTKDIKDDLRSLGGKVNFFLFFLFFSFYFSIDLPSVQQGFETRRYPPPRMDC